jgi:hypothetical protein
MEGERGGRGRQVRGGHAERLAENGGLRPRFQPDDQPDETLSYTYLQVVSSPCEPM